LISCSEQKKHDSQGPYNPKAIELNNRAVKLINQYKNDSALLLLDKAIDIDESYYMPHSNKVNIYVSQADYKKALRESELAIEKRPDLAEGWTMAGLLNEKLGDTLKAQQYYQKSIDLFEARINDPKKKDQMVANKLSRALSLILVGKEEEGKEELNKLKQENPDNFMIDQFLKINRKDFINKFFF
jgi:tetratricopeptide (TPR) repeat protein